MSRIDKAIEMVKEYTDPAVEEFRNMLPWKDKQDATIISDLMEKDEKNNNGISEVIEKVTTFASKKGGAVKGKQRGMGKALRGGGSVTRG
tara:strand:- start:447 stop:716 length:270 start_codon:yes stop_codon:yes gene_type:complete